MALSPGQLAVASCKTRMRVLVSGRRFGKTHLAIREMCKVAAQPNKTVWYCCPTYRQSKMVTWEPLKAKLFSLNWVVSTNETELSIRLKSGSTIYLKGADKPDSLRGTSIDFIVFDEVADVDPEAWNVIRPSLADRRGSALFIGTPKGRNWCFDLYNRGRDPTEEEWESFTYTTIEGGNVTEDEIEQAKKDLDERNFRQEFMATFEQYSGVVYYNFSPENNIGYAPVELVPRQELLVMTDFNVDPIAAVIGIRHEDKLYIIDEIVIYGSDTDELVNEITNRYGAGDYRITAYPDPAGVQRKTSAGGRTDITILQNARYNVKYKRSHPPIKDRVNAVNGLLKNSKGDVRLIISPKCKKLIECLTKQCYKEGTQVPSKDGGFDHINDALGYGVDYEWGIKRDHDTKQPEYWGVATR